MADLRDLELGEPTGNGRRITFCDERPRADVAAPDDRAASVTLDAHDGSSSWGEFLSIRDVLELRAWLDELARRHYAAPG
jgi:hypothetical protein